MPNKKREILGHVSTTSGTVMMLDFGFLDLWCHDNKPSFPEWLAPPEATEMANNAVDVKINGPDAVKAGKLFDRSWHPEYIYDIPQSYLEEFRKLFDESKESHKLDASLEILEERITHKKRIDLALTHGNGFGVVDFYRVWGLAISHMPKNQKITVYGERMADKKWGNSWRYVSVDIQPEGKVVATKILDHVLVDESNILIADVELLKKLSDHESLDGLADVAFWGKDEKFLTQSMKANKLSDNTFGWTDLSINEAILKGKELSELKEKGKLKFAFDFRPHTYKHSIFSQIRSSKTESGIIDLDGAIACCFMTSWGDGAFPVMGDFDAQDNLIRVRVDLGNQKTIENMEYVMSKS